MIAIVIPTYERPDGKTPFYLKRALNSIASQAYQDYRVFVIGDKYENENELFEIASGKKVKIVNLKRAKEREKYGFGDYRLFCAGGLNAVTTGIKLALNEGFEYICHLDHDDWWEPNHLKLISSTFNENPLFVCTVSTYYGGLFPLVKINGEKINYIPAPGCCCASSACIKYSDTKLRFRDCFKVKGKAWPGDADLWQRLGKEIKKKQLNSFLIQSLTCHHDEEGYSLKI